MARHVPIFRFSGMTLWRWISPGPQLAARLSLGAGLSSCLGWGCCRSQGALCVCGASSTLQGLSLELGQINQGNLMNMIA